MPRRARAGPRLGRPRDGHRRRPGGPSAASSRRARSSSLAGISPSASLRRAGPHPQGRAGHLALHERVDRRAEGEHPLAPRLRLQHRGLREAHRRLRARRRDGERAAPLLRVRDRDEPHVPLRGRRHRRPLQRAPHARVARARHRTCTAPPSSRTSPRCSASSSITTRRSREAGGAGARLRRACASRSRPARRSPRRSSGAGRLASAATSTTASARPRCSTSTPRIAPATSSPVARQVRWKATSCASCPRTPKGPGAAPCAPGEIGVLWVKGDSVSRTGTGSTATRAGRRSTATGAGRAISSRIDEDGYLYFAGRADELLKVSGLWVAPVEVEECLMRHEPSRSRPSSASRRRGS